MKCMIIKCIRTTIFIFHRNYSRSSIEYTENILYLEIHMKHSVHPLTSEHVPSIVKSLFSVNLYLEIL